MARRGNSPKDQEISIRKANLIDTEILLSWRNDPTTRMMFVNQHEVALADHQAWLTSTLGRDDRLLLVGCDSQSLPVGMVRFDLNLADATASVSITVDPHRRGQGQSRPLLSAAIKYLASNAVQLFGLGRLTLIAQIRKENISSIKLFQRLGFGNCVNQGDFYLLTLLIVDGK